MPMENKNAFITFSRMSNGSILRLTYRLISPYWKKTWRSDGYYSLDKAICQMLLTDDQTYTVQYYHTRVQIRLKHVQISTDRTDWQIGSLVCKTHPTSMYFGKSHDNKLQKCFIPINMQWVIPQLLYCQDIIATFLESISVMCTSPLSMLCVPRAFCLGPSHCGIVNERVDQLANQTFGQDIDPLSNVHNTDL